MKDECGLNFNMKNKLVARHINSFQTKLRKRSEAKKKQLVKTTK